MAARRGPMLAVPVDTPSAGGRGLIGPASVNFAPSA
jgi:hypothetical protein